MRRGSHDPMMAVIFTTESKDNSLLTQDKGDRSDEAEWQEVLRKLDQHSLQPFGSKRIYIDGLVRIVTDREILIIKRNEQRFWTATAAREDAEATLVQAIQLQQIHQETHS